VNGCPNRTCQRYRFGLGSFVITSLLPCASLEAEVAKHNGGE